MAKRPKTRGLRSGAPAPVSGQYEKRGPRGGHTGCEVTAVKGKPLPPPGRARPSTSSIVPGIAGLDRGR